MAKVDTKCPKCYRSTKRSGVVSWTQNEIPRLTPKYDCLNGCRNEAGKSYVFTITEEGRKVEILDLASESVPVS